MYGDILGLKEENKKIIMAYIEMIADGRAFSNWENPPDSQTRSNLVESFVKASNFKGVLDFSRNEKELKRLLDEMEIKEEEFQV